MRFVTALDQDVIIAIRKAIDPAHLRGRAPVEARSYVSLTKISYILYSAHAAYRAMER
jgi:hypothetical protein